MMMMMMMMMLAQCLEWLFLHVLAADALARILQKWHGTCAHGSCEARMHKSQ